MASYNTHTIHPCSCSPAGLLLGGIQQMYHSHFLSSSDCILSRLTCFLSNALSSQMLFGLIFFCTTIWLIAVVQHHVFSLSTTSLVPSSSSSSSCLCLAASTGVLLNTATVALPSSFHLTLPTLSLFHHGYLLYFFQY
jgi:hypothetical protein